MSSTARRKDGYDTSGIMVSDNDLGHNKRTLPQDNTRVGGTKQTDGSTSVVYTPAKFEEDNPPTYEATVGGLANVILRVLAEANQIFNLDDLKHLETKIIIDDNHRTDEASRDVIKLLGWVLTLVLKAHGAMGSIYMMSYTNPQRPDSNEDERALGVFLETIFKKASAYEIHSAINAWDAPKLVRSNCISLDKGTLVAEASIAMESEGQRKDRLTKLLSLVREAIIRQAEPFDIEDLTFDSFSENLRKAIYENSQQTYVLSSLTSWLVRELYWLIGRAEEKNKNPDVKSGKVIFLTTSPTGHSDKHRIKTVQSKIRGGANDFSLVVVHLVPKDDHESARHQRELDDFKNGDRDMWEYIQLRVPDVMRLFVSGKVVAKILGSHNATIDNMKLKDDEKYGSTEVRDLQGKIHLPTSQMLRETLRVMVAPVRHFVEESAKK